jgi:hypothetical protein
MKWGFILSVLASLVAMVLGKLASKLYLRFQHTSIPELSRGFLKILIAQSFTTRILSPSIAFTIAFFMLVNISPQTVIAPSRKLAKYTGVRMPSVGQLGGVIASGSPPNVDDLVFVPCKKLTPEELDYGLRTNTIAQGPEPRSCMAHPQGAVDKSVLTAN